MYDDDETPSEPEINEPSAPLQITLHGWDAGQVERALIPLLEQRFRKTINERLQAAIDGAIRRRVDELVKEHIEKRVDAEITRAIAEGWQKTDSYGQPKGQVLTIKTMILEFLQASEYGRQSRLDRVIQETVSAALNKELGKEVEAARATVKSLLDDEIKGRFTKALKEALGVGR